MVREPAVAICPGAAAAVSGSAVAVSWAGPGPEGDRETLDRWCRTVGPPVLRLEPGAEGTTWRRGEPLTVVAWNMNVGGGDLVAFLGQELGVDCGPGARRVPPFALLLQEAYRRSAALPLLTPESPIPFVIEPPPRPGPKIDIVEVAERCGLALVYVPSARNGTKQVDGEGEDKGNAVLSNVPLVDPVAVELPYEAGRKVAVGATVHGPGGSLRVVSVHLDVASTLLRTFLTGNGTRARQAEGLANGLDLIDPAIATVAAGDYNTWSETETALQRLRRRYPDSPPLAADPTRGHFATDHIFFRTDPDRRWSVVDDSYRPIPNNHFSDHSARAVEITASAETSSR